MPRNYNGIITGNFKRCISMWKIDVKRTKEPLIWLIDIHNYVHYYLCLFAFNETFKQELSNKEIEILPRTLWDKINTNFTRIKIKFNSDADEASFIVKTLGD